ncbi:MAG: AAA family ATPase [Planctomycetota bacterium]
MTPVDSTVSAAVNEAEILRHLSEFRTALRAIREELQRVIVGQETVLDGVLAALFLNGHVLLEGVPGLGKTLLVRTLGVALGLKFNRIQFTPDLMPADIIGTRLVQQNAEGRMEFEFVPGPVFTHLLLGDEINRATPKTQSALLEAMQERQVTVAGVSMPLPRPFLVMATQNPLEMEGTYPLPEAQLDRFLFKINVPFPDQLELVEIGRRTTARQEPCARQAIAEPQQGLPQWNALIRQIPVSKLILDFAARMILATHRDHGSEIADKYIRYGASPRGLQALILAGKYNAAVEGRATVSRTDIARWAVPCLQHRIILNFDAQSQDVSVEGVIEQTLRRLD